MDAAASYNVHSLNTSDVCCQVTLIDQSPHQLAKAKAKPALRGVTILEASFDLNVSSGAGYLLTRV